MPVIFYAEILLMDMHTGLSGIHLSQNLGNLHQFFPYVDMLGADLLTGTALYTVGRLFLSFSFHQPGNPLFGLIHISIESIVVHCGKRA